MQGYSERVFSKDLIKIIRLKEGKIKNSGVFLAGEAGIIS
jgi:hypothetical protein